MTTQVTVYPKDPTVQQTAEIFQCTPKTIYDRIKDGTLESYLIGNMRRIRRESIEAVRNRNNNA